MTEDERRLLVMEAVQTRGKLLADLQGQADTLRRLQAGLEQTGRVAKDMRYDAQSDRIGYTWATPDEMKEQLKAVHAVKADLASVEHRIGELDPDTAKQLGLLKKGY